QEKINGVIAGAGTGANVADGDGEVTGFTGEHRVGGEVARGATVDRNRRGDAEVRRLRRQDVDGGADSLRGVGVGDVEGDGDGRNNEGRSHIRHHADGEDVTRNGRRN